MEDWYERERPEKGGVPLVFSEMTYSVLLVSAAQKANEALLPLLPGNLYYPVSVVKSVSAAKRCLLERRFDLILVNAPLPDDLGLRLAEEACADSAAGVLLLVRRELYDEVCDRVSQWGVAVLPKPVGGETVTQTLQLLRATRERMRRLEEKQLTVEEQIGELRLVNRAKWLLIEKRGMSEAEAHREIEKQAMDSRRSKAAVARELLARAGERAD